MSEGSWVPKTWEEWVSSTVWGVIILGFGLEFCAKLVTGDYGHALVALFFLGLVSVMLLHGAQARSWAMSISPNWAVAAFMVALLIVLFLPFIEEKRYPLSAWSPSPSQTVVHNPPTADDIAKAAAPVQAKLDAMTRQRDAAQTEIATLKQQQAAQQAGPARSSPASPQVASDPITWGELGFGYMGGPEPIFIDIEIPAQITAPFPVEVKDAYIVSGTTGARLPMMLDAGKSGKILPSESYPIPNGLGFYLTAELKPPLSTLDLLSQWGKVYFFAEYGDKKYQATFDENYMRTKLSQYHGSPLGAHITKKPDAK